MSFSVNTNNNAMAALRTLSSTNQSLSETQNRINSGLAISGAKDNASTFAIAQGMRGDIAGLKAVKSTLQLGETTVNVGLAAAEKISNKLTELKNKVTEGQASNRDSAAIQRDVESMVTQIDTMAKAAQFNGVNLLDGVNTNPFDVVSSLNRTSATAVDVERISVERQNMTSAGLGIGGLNVQGSTGGLKFDDTLDPTDDETIDIDVFATAKDGTNTSIKHIFEFTDDPNEALTSAPAAGDANGVGVVNVHAVHITGTESPTERLGKLAEAMRSAGFSVTMKDDGSIAVNSSSSAKDLANAGSGVGIKALTNGVTGAVDAYDTDGDGTADANVAPGKQLEAMATIEDAINRSKEAVAKLGTAANQLTTQKEFVSTLNDLITSGVGTLVDADLAEESAKLQALQTKQQLGIQALSIANQGPGAVMSLFR